MLPAAPNTLYTKVLKRQFDIVISLTAIVVMLPVMLLVGVAVRIVLGSPVFFHEERAGFGGRPIRVTKFRSMSDARDKDGQLLPDYARLSAFGKWLRRTSLDELPQLLSVLFGDMSIVGPRPLPMRYVARYDARQAARLFVRPGLTGLAQVSGRNAIDWMARLELDVKYVETLATPAGPLTDLAIVLRTVLNVFVQALTGRGIAEPGSVTMREFKP